MTPPPVSLLRTPPACTTPPEFIEPRPEPEPTEPQPTIRLGDAAAGLALWPHEDGALLIAHAEDPDDVEVGRNPLRGQFVTVPLSVDDLAALSVAAWALKTDAERGAR